MEEWKGEEERKRGRKNGRTCGRRDSEYESGRNSESEYTEEEEERKLTLRRELLVGQLEEARWLKLNIEKRSKKVRFSSIKVEVGNVDILIHQSFAHA